MHRPAVLANIAHLKSLNGEVWFKLDAGTRNDIQRINHVHVNPQQHLARLKACAALCPTFIQTCVFAWHSELPDEAFIQAYIDCVSQVRDVVEGVYLYGVARPSYQPEAPFISRLSLDWLDALADKIRALGLTVHVSE